MPRTSTTRSSDAPTLPTAVGIDVGGTDKGFHAVAITGGNYSCCIAAKDVQELAHWCRVKMRARVIAVDAPCRWSKDGRSRPAERELMEKRIWCFSTPTLERAVERERQSAVGKATNHFGWMLQGAKLFEVLKPTHVLCRKLPLAVGENHCFETFPHGIAWHLSRRQVIASRKREQRKQILTRSGIDTSLLTNNDLVDAALCALVAYRAATLEPCASYGEPETGLIIVPLSRD